MTTYHLLRDLGIYKATVKRNYFDNDRGPEYADVRELLERRTQRYTLVEIRKLTGFFWTAHDECVLHNPEDYNPLQVHAAAEKVRFGEVAIKKLESLSA